MSGGREKSGAMSGPKSDVTPRPAVCSTWAANTAVDAESPQEALMPSTNTNDGSVGVVADADPVSAAEHRFYTLVEPTAATTDRPVPVKHAFAKDLERVPEAAAEARHLVSDALQAWNLPQLVEDAELIVSELVSNTVAHAVGDCIQVTMLRLSRQRVRISVVDRDSRHPERRAPDADGERGRGLLLVEACSSQWGVRVIPGEKSVWSELEAAT
jgi:anti-sigma regulatory factor (Ser/Thr protein kinase)